MQTDLLKRIVIGVGVIGLVITGWPHENSVAAQQFSAKPPVAMPPHDLDASYIRMPLPPSEQQYGRIDGDHLRQMVDDITAISRKSRDAGDVVWGRLAGTTYDDMVEGVVESKFRQLGLTNVHRQYFDLPTQSFPTTCDVKAKGGGKTMQFTTVQPVTPFVATPAGGIDAEAVWVGLGTEGDFAGRDVRGKVVVVQSMPMPGVVAHSAAYNGSAKRAAERGAAAMIVNIAIPGNYKVAAYYGAELPSFSIGTEEMTALQKMMTAGPVHVQARMDVERRNGLRDANVWGELPGATDEDIIVMAHHDAYFEGALDNASGMAVMIGLAEYFAKIPKDQRRRTIKFVTTSGHHAGSLGTKWMHDNRSTFLAKTALAINCEHVAVTQAYFDRMSPTMHMSDNIDARRWWVNGSSQLATMVLNAYRLFGVTIYDTMDPTTTADMAVMDRDVPSIQLIESAVYYHTDHDTVAVVPAPGLAAVARAYAKIIDQVNTLSLSALMPVPPKTTTRAPGL
jgi:hypothetical protein